MATKFSKFGFRFVPLVNEDYGLSCNLDILMFRWEQPGRIVMQGEDIDIRIKTLFDALCMPVSQDEIGTPEQGEDPFFCLLESDTMIDEVHVVTDCLLLPAKSDREGKHVLLLIGVELKIVNPEIAYLEFAMH